MEGAIGRGQEEREGEEGKEGSEEIGRERGMKGGSGVKWE